MRLTLRALVFVVALLGFSASQAREASAIWSRDGILLAWPLVTAGPRLGSDGAGGVFVTWVPIGSGAVGYWNKRQVGALRITSDGTSAPGWPDSGVVIGVANQSGANSVESIDAVIPDGLGGAYVQYKPYITHTSWSCLAHVTTTGPDFNGWPRDFPLSPLVSIAVNDPGGLLCAYRSYNYYGWAMPISLQRIRRDGSQAAIQQPLMTQANVFPEIDTNHSGGALACRFCEVQGLDSSMTEVWSSGPWPGCTSNMALVSDGLHGAFLAWVSGSIMRVTRVDSLGHASPGWPTNGFDVGVADVYSGNPLRLTGDGAGGFFLRWQIETAYLVQRITGAGVVAPGWSPSGTVLGPPDYSTAPSEIVPDGEGGLYVAWQAAGTPQTGGDIYAQRLTSAGVPAPGWLATGSPICTAPGYQTGVSVAPDGFGGVYLAWRDYRNGPNPQIYAQHLLKNERSVIAAPDSPALALSIAVRANPSRSSIQCYFTVPSTLSARIDVFDTAGRRVYRRTIDEAPAGANRASLALKDAPPGLYLVRLSQAGLNATTRVVVIP